MDDPAERRRVDPGRRLADRRVALTPRQRQVLDLVSAGAPNKEIAERLAVSEQAAKQQVSTLLDKFDVKSRAALVSSALALQVTGQRATDLPLEYLFDRAPMAIALLSGADHVFRAVNGTFTEIFGDRRGWIGLPLSDLLTKRERIALAPVDLVYRSGRPVQRVELPVTISDLDGHTVERFLTVTLHPTRDRAGNVAGLIFFGLDVTEQVLLRRRVEALAAEKKAILEQLPPTVSVVVVDRMGRPAFGSGPLRDLLGPGLDPAAPFARHVARIGARWAATGLPLSETNSPSVRALRGEATESEVVFQPADGGPEAHAYVSARPLRDLNGEIMSAVMVFEIRRAT